LLSVYSGVGNQEETVVVEDIAAVACMPLEPLLIRMQMEVCSSVE
jgi:hypothetical protein